jgi:hypothetical protein
LLHQVDLIKARPIFAGDEQPIALRVISDAVENRVSVAGGGLANKVAEVDPAVTLPLAGSMRAMRGVIQTLANTSPFTHSSSFSRVTGPAAVGDGDAAALLHGGGVEIRSSAVPSLMMISWPLLVRPQPRRITEGADLAEAFAVPANTYARPARYSDDLIAEQVLPRRTHGRERRRSWRTGHLPNSRGAGSMRRSVLWSHEIAVMPGEALRECARIVGVGGDDARARR